MIHSMEIISVFSVIAIIGLAIYAGQLSRRISEIEKHISAQQGQHMSQPRSATDDGQQYPERGEETAAPASSSTASADGSETLRRVGAWLKEDWLLKVGALLILIALGWFVSYAFINDWVGPIGRISLGLVAGTGVIAFGYWWMRQHRQQGAVLLLLGAGTVIVTVWAARFVYGFFTPATALAMMFAAVFLLAVASITFRVYWVSVAALVLAAVIPLLTDTADPSYVMLFSYLLAVVLAVVWVAALTGWRSLGVLALIAVALYSVPHWVLGGTSADTAVVLLLISFAIGGLLVVANTLAIVRRGQQLMKADFLTAGATAVFILFWILTVVPEAWQSLVCAAWLVVFAAGAFAVYRLTDVKAPFYVYAAASVLFLAAATAVELDGAVLVIAYSIEAAALVAGGYALLPRRRDAHMLTVLYVVPVVLSVPSITAPVWQTGVFHEHFAVLVVVFVVLALSGYAAYASGGHRRTAVSERVGGTCLVAASLYAFTLIWLVSHALTATADIATGISLVIYTVVGLIAYAAAGIKWVRIYGGVILAGVIGRLLLIDVWDMELTGRIITFFLIGALLVGTALLARYRTRTGGEDARL